MRQQRTIMEGKKSKQTTGHEEISRALQLIKHNIQTPSMENEEEMKKVIHELPKILQLSLARITRNIEVEAKDSPITFFVPAVGRMFAQEDQHTAFLVLTKEDENSKFKTAVLKELEPKGTISNMKEMLLKTLPYQLRSGAKIAKNVVGRLSGMFTCPGHQGHRHNRLPLLLPREHSPRQG